MTNSLFDLPFDAFDNIIKYSGGLRVLGLLGASVVNKSLRAKFMNFLSSQVFDFTDNILVSNSFATFVIERNVSLVSKSIKCKPDIDPSLLFRFLSTVSHLQSIDLSGYKKFSELSLTDAFSCIRALNLSNCYQLTDACMHRVLNRCSTLLYLNLSDCIQLTDATICRVAECCSALTSLNLYQCSKVSDFSVCRVAMQCSSLRSLNLYQCLQITDTSAIRLSQVGSSVLA